MPTSTITDLPRLVENLPAAKQQRLRRIFRIDASYGECIIPTSMQPWARQHFGSIEAVQHQHIIRITNVHTWEGAIYNPLRAGRPLQVATPTASPSPSNPNANANLDFGFDVFADPLRTTAADVFGRVRGEYCITTGNIARWEGQHAVLIFDEFDALTFERQHMRDYFRTALAWAHKAHAHNPAARYFVWTWNGGLKGGASIPHAHAQMALGQHMHYARVEQLRRVALAYRASFGSSYFDDVLGAHHDVGLRFAVAGLPALLYLAALRAKEVWVMGHAFDEQLADGVCDALRGLIDKTGTQAFNVGVYMPPLWPDADQAEDWSDFPVIARIVDRGPAGMLSSDVGALDIFAHQVMAVDPYRVWASLHS